MPELMTTIFGFQKGHPAVRIMERLEKWSLARADLVITVNAACERIFAGRSCPSEKIGVVMNAPDDKIFHFQPPSPAPAKRDPGRPFALMYHGSLVERNGLDLAVEALAQVSTAIPGAELRICGNKTPFLEKVMSQVGERGLTDRVRYLGPKSLEEIVREIGRCDLGVIPNQRSAFSKINTPTRIFEYLAMGKPVIAARGEGVCDYFDDRSLLLFELGDARDLAAQIAYAFSYPAETTEIVRRGQEVYRKHNWPAEKGRLLDLVTGLLCGAAVPETAKA
jgi:glycosyltransferase involved in cell wall biosynthesis